MLRKLSIIVSGLILAAVFAQAACAEESKTAAVVIPVSCETTHPDDEYTAVIVPEDDSYLYTIKEKDLHFKGTGEKSFALEFTQPGNYHYTVRQSASLQGGGSFDQNTHYVTVCVSWDDFGNLKAEAVIYQEDHNDKEMQIRFSNVPKSYYAESDNKDGTKDGYGTEEDESESSPEPAEAQQEGNGSAQEGNSNVQTGDDTPIGTMLALMAVSAAAAAALLRKRNTRNA